MEDHLIHQAGIEVVYYTDGETIRKIRISEEIFLPSSVSNLNSLLSASYEAVWYKKN